MGVYDLKQKVKQVLTRFEKKYIEYDKTKSTCLYI